MDVDGVRYARILSGSILLLGVLLLGLVLGAAAQEGGFRVFPTSLEVSEPNGSASFSIKLTEQPTATVTIGLSTSNDECSVLSPSVELTEDNAIKGSFGVVFTEPFRWIQGTFVIEENPND